MKKFKLILISGLVGLLLGSGITFAVLYAIERHNTPQEKTIVQVVDFDLNKVLKNCAKLSLIELNHNVEIVSSNDFLWGHSNMTATARSFVSIGIDCDLAFIDDDKKEIVIPHSEVLSCGLNNLQVVNEQLSMLAPISFDKYAQCLGELISKEKHAENLEGAMKEADETVVKYITEALEEIGCDYTVRFLGE